MAMRKFIGSFASAAFGKEVQSHNQREFVQKLSSLSNTERYSVKLQSVTPTKSPFHPDILPPTTVDTFQYRACDYKPTPHNSDSDSARAKLLLKLEVLDAAFEHAVDKRDSAAVAPLLHRDYVHIVAGAHPLVGRNDFCKQIQSAAFCANEEGGGAPAKFARVWSEDGFAFKVSTFNKGSAITIYKLDDVGKWKILGSMK